MERNSKQEYSLEKTVKILAEMMKKDIQKLDNSEDFSDIESTHSYQKTPVPHPV